MGLMIDIVAAERVAEPRRIARLLRALGGDTATVDGWQPRSADEIDLLVDAAVAGCESRIDFAGDPLGGDAVDALGALVRSIEGYFDVHTPIAALRVWPREAWMHGYRRLDDEVVSAILGEPVRLDDGVTTIADVTFSLPSPNGHVPFDVRTSRIDVATRLYLALIGDAPTRGSCASVHGATREPLRRLLHAVNAEVRACVELDVDVAAELVERVGHEWLQWDGPVRVVLPEGEISTYLLAPVDPVKEAAWRAWVSAAVAAIDPSSVK